MAKKKTLRLVEELVMYRDYFHAFSDEAISWTIENPQAAIMLMAKAVTERNKKRTENPFLKLISSDKPPIIDAVDGHELLSDAREVFTVVGNDFKRQGADEKGQGTSEALVDVYEITQSGTFEEIFGSLSADKENLIFTQHQIKSFVKKYPDHLRTNGDLNFFAFKSRRKYFVAIVNCYSSGVFGVVVRKFEYPFEWNANALHRFVVPYLA